MSSSATALSPAERLAELPEVERLRVLSGLGEEQIRALLADWRFHARPKQLAPEWDWLTWLVEAGRGFGKTRLGTGFIHERAEQVEGRWMALIAKNPADARDYMIEGPGGLLKHAPLWCLDAPGGPWPKYEPSKRRVSWPNGSWATIYSSEDADQIRGFSGDTAWIDELAKYRNPREVWDNLQFGMREASSDQPRTVITTTPRPLPLLEEIESEDTTALVTGSSYENRANLSPVWFTKTLAKYEGTRLGDQEIHGVRLEDVEGRVYSSFSKKPYPEGNVDESVADTGGEILVGQDFNVNPMASVIAVRVGDECHIIDSLEVQSSNTEEVAREIRGRYPDRQIVVCPDPSGKARKTSAKAGVTDFTILEDFGFEVRAPSAAPAVRDRENNANAMYLKGDRRRVRIHPRCKALIKALSGLQYKEGTSIRDKASGYDHVCDAADYLLWQEFNVLVEPGAAEPFPFRLY